MSNEKQQSPVEWYASKIHTVVNNTTDALTHNDKELLEQAKEMEKEQHSKTWDASRVGYTGDSFRDSVFGLVKDFSEYYEETYGGNK